MADHSAFDGAYTDSARKNAAAAPAGALPEIRRIGLRDLGEALALGAADFWARPSHLVFLGLIYALVGLVASRIAFGYQAVLPLLFPMAAGFALIGPLAAIGLYELSRRRERGLEVSLVHAFGVLRSPSIGAIARLSLLLLAIFFLWLAAAQQIYVLTLGPAAPESLEGFVRAVLGTPAGLRMIVFGNAVGFLFAVVAFAVSVVSFPMLVDRPVPASVALATSLRAVAANLGPMTVWAAIVAGLLVLGSLPLFVGLAVVVPVLGHATWHLYRRVVVP